MKSKKINHKVKELTIELNVTIIIESIKRRVDLEIRSNLCKSIMASVNLDTYKRGEKWKAYVDQLNSFILLKDIPREKRKDFLITQLSTPVYEILCNICFPDSPQNPKYTFDDLLKILDDYLNQSEKYVAHFEYNKDNQSVQQTIKEYKFTEQLTQGIKTEAMCFKVYRGSDSLKDFVNFATEVDCDHGTTIKSQSSEVSGNKSGVFAVSGFRRTNNQHGDMNQTANIADFKTKDISVSKEDYCCCCGNCL